MLYNFRLAAYFALRSISQAVLTLPTLGSIQPRHSMARSIGHRKRLAYLILSSELDSFIFIGRHALAWVCYAVDSICTQGNKSRKSVSATTL